MLTRENELKQLCHVVMCGWGISKSVYNISCNQFQLVLVMQKTGMDRSVIDAHLEGLVLVLVATI